MSKAEKDRRRAETRIDDDRQLTVDLRREFLRVLAASEGKTLATLADELTLAARGEYTVGGIDALRAGAGLRAFNEIFRVVAAQLGRAAGTGARGYPPEAFVETIWESAVQGEIHKAVGHAIGRTVTRAALADTTVQK